MKKTRTLLFSALLIALLTFTPHAIADEDTRKTISLSDLERNLVLAEMRSFLTSLQEITFALSKDDMTQVAKSAKKVGMGEQQAMPKSITQKLPMAFKQLGMKTHKAFDQLAMDAMDMEDTQQTLEQLGTLIKNCVSCHATFKIQVEK